MIHTDFEKGFIRAEVISYNDYIQQGSEAKCRAAGVIGQHLCGKADIGLIDQPPQPLLDIEIGVGRLDGILEFIIQIIDPDVKGIGTGLQGSGGLFHIIAGILLLGRQLVHLVDVHERHVRLLFHFQQCIALLECLVIIVKCRDVSTVILGNHHVHQSSPLLAPSLDDDRVGRRDKNERQQADMFGESLVLFLIALEMFLLTTLHTTIDMLYVAILTLELPFEHEEILSVANHLRVDGAMGALAEGKEMHGIEKIGFSHTISPQETVHLGRQPNVG